MIQKQEVHGGDRARFYAYCGCGVCGPLRVDRRLAVDDERVHAKVCSGQAQAKGNGSHQ